MSIPHDVIRLTYLVETPGDVDRVAAKIASDQSTGTFVALPGGIGTLEELVEQLTWAQLGRHRKPILLVEVNGFWKPLLTLFDHMRAHGFIREGLDLNYVVAEGADAVVPTLQSESRRLGDDPAAERFVTERL